MTKDCLKVKRAMGRRWSTLGELYRRLGRKYLTTTISARIRENRTQYGIDYERRVRKGTCNTHEYRRVTTH